MKRSLFLFLMVCLSASAIAQKQKISKTRFVIGISGPEFLHAGITYRIANISQLGVIAEWKAFALLPLECIGGNKYRLEVAGIEMELDAKCLRAKVYYGKNNYYLVRKIN